MGPWGPLREEGVPPLGLGAKGGAHPHGGGEEDGTPLGLYKEGYTPLFPMQHTISLLLLPRADSPCLESAPGLEFFTIGRPSLCRSRDPNSCFFRCSPGSRPVGNI